jgi:hypothetical protein
MVIDVYESRYRYTRCASAVAPKLWRGTRPAAPENEGCFLTVYPGRRSRTRFALGYYRSPFEGFVLARGRARITWQYPTFNY